MEQKQHHYTGLTDAQVLESRAKHGVNVITPPEEGSVWDKVKDGRHFWLNKVIAILLVLAVALLAVLQVTGTVMLNKVWIGPVILLALLLLTWTVSFLGGDWDEEKQKFDMDPLITILLAALVLSGAISFYQGVFGGEEGIRPFFEPIGIAIAVLLATGVAHWLESRNEKTFKSLNEVNDDTLVKVVRNDNVCQIPRRDVVVGDIVLLTTGEEVPADCRILESFNMTVNESMFTGETEAVKGIGVKPKEEPPYPVDYLLKGSIIMAGNATAEVFAVGDKTENGKVFESAQVQDGEATPLSQKLDQLADLITKASYVIAGLIIIGRMIIYFAGGHSSLGDTEGAVGFVKYLLDTVMIAVTLIVVAVPEGLPMAVTLSLAFSMRRLMQQNTLPRTMHACETMGAASVICTDKTGTLTQNQMQVADTYFPNEEADRTLIEESIAVNTTANLDHADPQHIRAIGSPTEGALLLWLNGQGKNYLTMRESVQVVERIPFSTEIKYMASVVQSQAVERRVIYLTGAPDILMSLCEMTDDERKAYNDKLLGWQSQAYRTLGLAGVRLNGDKPVTIDGQLQEIYGLKMLGIVAISDPIRPEVPASIAECLKAGIQVKIVTGDTPGTAKEIGRQCGLWDENDNDQNILMGSDLAAMEDKELKQRLPQVKIISRARPADKERAVRLLKELGHVVAVTGDGTNDAPALNAANVGLSMGDGTAVAKEASDMTILDNSFSTIANAVMWGRSLYKNIKRFILFQMTVNVAACLIVLIGAFIGTESPLTVTQMLWVNLIMDTFAALALASLPPTHKVMSERPRPIDEHILKGMGWGILGVGGLFTIILLAVLLFFQHADITSLSAITWEWGEYNGLTSYELGLFFTLFVMFQFWNMFNAKAFMTSGSAFKGISWKNTRWFIIIMMVIFFGQVAIVQLGGEMFNVAQGGLHLMDWVILFVSTSFVLWIGELMRLIKK